MAKQNVLLESIIIVACVACIIITFSMFRHLKFKEVEFNEKKAMLIKENLDLKDDMSSFQQTIAENQSRIETLEQEKVSVVSTLKDIEKTNKELNLKLLEQAEEFAREKTLLQSKSAVFDEYPVLQQVYDVLKEDSSGTLRQILDMAIRNADSIIAGDFVELEPITVTGEEYDEPSVLIPLAAKPVFTGTSGTILSLDKNNALIVLDLGRKDDVMSGDKCSVVNALGQGIATGEVISVRYKVSAAVIEGITPGHTLDDISEGNAVYVE